jgi:hypothetical protein
MKSEMYKFGNINSNLIGDFKDIKFSTRRQFSDDETVENWKKAGHWYVNYGGFILEHVKGLPNWCDNVLDEISKQVEIFDASYSLYCMPPGTIMPEHRDTYPTYRKIYNVDDVNKIRRVLVFVEDWKSGHYFEVDDTPVVKWKCGDYCTWIGDTPHIASNIGRENRYTLQITGKIYGNN